MRGFNLALFFFILVSTQSLASDHSIVLLNSERGVLLSENGGRTWRDFNTGLPGGLSALEIRTDSKGALYLLTRGHGLYRCNDYNEGWLPLNCEGFLSRAKNIPREYRKITAFAAGGSRTAVLVCATKHALHRSTDGGAHWSPVPMRALEHNHYITSLALDARHDVIAGTSFNGLYRINGNRFTRTSNGLPHESFSPKRIFYEEISAIAVDPGNPAVIFAGLNFGGGVYASKDAGRSWLPLSLPIGEIGTAWVSDIALRGNLLYIACPEGVICYNRSTGESGVQKIDSLRKRLPGGDNSFAFLLTHRQGRQPPLFFRIGTGQARRVGALDERASERRAIYASVPAVRRRLPLLLSTIKKCGLNAIVVDMKDDFGALHFPTSNTTAAEIGARGRALDVVSLLRRLRREGVYAIARVVVFKDEKLYRAYENRYAIRHVRTNEPWEGRPKEYWVDPHSDFVQEYNIALARELGALGFDEIQFDYVRFPSDGPTNLCVYPFRQKSDAFKSEVVCDFLARAKRELEIPLSVDIYGFNAWYRFGNWIGQDIEEIARYADAICPMVYPSHFGPQFYNRYEGDEHAYRIVRDSGIRARYLAGNGVPIRPYLQAFRMRSPSWGPGYIRAQLMGAHEGGSAGYTFWNSSGEYRMLRESLGK